jgi:hypothetical protein
MPIISNIAAAIVSSTTKRFSGSKSSLNFPNRSSSGNQAILVRIS